MLRHMLATCLALLPLVPVGASANEVSEFTLDNGLHAVVIEDHRAPVVVHMLWYRVGAADEPPGRSGIAHFLEHLMFKATDELESGELSETVNRNGGSDNAFTAQDYTGYFQRIASDRLDLVMKMEADRMTDLVLTEASGDMLLHNPEALRAFEAYLMDERFRPRESLWPVAAQKNGVYGENRKILLDGLAELEMTLPETGRGPMEFRVREFVDQLEVWDQIIILDDGDTLTLTEAERPTKGTAGWLAIAALAFAAFAAGMIWPRTPKSRSAT